MPFGNRSCPLNPKPLSSKPRTLGHQAPKLGFWQLSCVAEFFITVADSFQAGKNTILSIQSPHTYTPSPKILNLKSYLFYP